MQQSSMNVTSRICFDHARNFWTASNGRLLLSQSYEGHKFPEEKQSLLALIEKQLQGDG